MSRVFVTLSVASLVGTLASSVALAEKKDSTKHWEGSGTAHDVSGKDLGAFRVEVSRTTIGEDVTRMDGVIALGNGQTKSFWQDQAKTPSGGFRIQSDKGPGGGRCFANGMCQTYVESASGQAFATTISRDSDEKLRILITELANGKAVRFYEQTLKLKQ